MKSIEKNFEKIQEKNPYWSSLVCFSETIRNRKFNSWKNTVSWFNKLVDKDDYDKRDKKEILTWLQTSAFSKGT